MYFPLIKMILTLGTANPVPPTFPFNVTSLAARQDAWNPDAYTAFEAEGLCESWDGNVALIGWCWIVIYEQQVYIDPVNTEYLSSLYLLNAWPTCTFIGYEPGPLQLESTWFSLDSQLPYTVDIITYNTSSLFWYGGIEHDMDNIGAGKMHVNNDADWVYWFPFVCGPTGPWPGK